MTAPVVIVPTGTANLASVRACLNRLGRDTKIADSPEDVVGAGQLVLPGVGTFGAASSRLDELGLTETIRGRVAERRPTLAICVGMQLLATTSDESPGAIGLGIIEDELSGFDSEVRVPQMGWNRVEASPSCRFVESGWAYFANSFRISTQPPSWDAAVSDYGGSFVAAMESGDVLACQFHPELSGPWGSALVGRWLEGRAA